MPDFLDWRDVEFDPALFGRKLQGVGQQVHQDLLDAQGIADIDLLKERRGKQVEYYALRHRAAVCERADGADEFIKIKRFGSQAHLAAFDLGDVQDVIDERQQETGRQGDIVQALAEPFGVAHVHARNGRHADDRVHRRSDVVRHPGKELAFGMVGLFGGNERHTQRSLLALLFLNVFGAKEEHPPYGVKKIRP